jgi:hypothetical protein
VILNYCRGFRHSCGDFGERKLGLQWNWDANAEMMGWEGK